MTKVFPQFVVIRSLNVTVVALQASAAVAKPVLAGLESAGNSNVRLAGQVITGGVRSRTVMLWTQLTELPHSSVAVHVRAITLVAPQLLVSESL